MRGLSGDFSTMPLKDLVAYLGSRKATGTLRIMRAGVRKLILLRDGQVVSASSNQPHEFLGQFLIDMGHLNEEQFSKAYATQRETRVPLGKILVMAGLVAEQTVRGALNLKFREALLDMFRWEEGEFSFDAGAVPEVDGMDVRVDLADVRREGESREAAGTGDGPIDAVYKALAAITHSSVKLQKYEIRSVTSGTEALGEATGHLEQGDSRVVGRGASTDIIEASAKAYVDGLNKLARLPTATA
ncbi:MAG: alpha-isopropylmalate synthase regulatory domain-containing protein [Archangium sp.]